MLKIFNTLTKKLEEFKPIEPDKVRFYHCGPTVYWIQHIGNMRAMAMADLVHRTLEYLDYDVNFVRNYTDVGHLASDEDEGEDKISEGAKREGLDPQDLADKYIKVFEHDVNGLNVMEPDHKPRATKYIQEMIDLVQTLLDKGYAYSTRRAIYFDTSKFGNYTQLSGQKLDKQESGAGHGAHTDPNKKHPADFSIWFFKAGPHKDALQTWESPFESEDIENGEGFPGWHVECSAMSIALLGETLDIHMGGIEHVPVHHTNEIAQSEAATGKTFVNYWLHNEHLTVDGGKMAKSEGTSYSLADLIDKGYDPIVLRYFFLQAHYRSKQNFTWDSLKASKTAYERLLGRVGEVFTKADMNHDPILPAPDIEWKGKFTEAIEDDFNVPQALAITWDLLKSNVEDGIKLSTVLDFDKVLGLKFESTLENPHQPVETTDEIDKLIKERKQAREEKDWDKSDEIRDRLSKEFGIMVEDTENGQKISKK